MLYQLYELQHVTMAPMRMFAHTAMTLLDTPFNPLREASFTRMAVAALDSFEHSTRQFGKPEFELNTTLIDGQEVPITEEIVAPHLWCELKHFRRTPDRPDDPKVLIVAPMSGHYATLLRGTVEAFLPHHNVYITDWQDARDVPFLSHNFELDDYVEYIMEYIRLLGPDVHVIAVCQPSVPVVAAVSLMNENEPDKAPRSMTLMGGPIDTREAPTQVNQFAKRHSIDWFRNHVIHRVPFGNPGFMRLVYPGFLQLAGFMAMNLEKHVEAHWEMFQHLVEGDDEPLASKRSFYDEYRAVMDLPADFYLQTLQAVFHEHRLPRGTFTWRGQKVDTHANTRTALLTVEGERDDISGIGQTKATHRLMDNLPSDMREHWEQPGVGHYGLFNGRKFRQEVAPRIFDFIQKHRDPALKLVAGRSVAA